MLCYKLIIIENEIMVSMKLIWKASLIDFSCFMSNTEKENAPFRFRSKNTDIFTWIFFHLYSFESILREILGNHALNIAQHTFFMFVHFFIVDILSIEKDNKSIIYHVFLDKSKPKSNLIISLINNYLLFIT